MSIEDLRPTQLYKIWELTSAEMSSGEDPRTLNYKTELLFKLHPIYTFNSGYLVQVRYLAEHEDEDSEILNVEFEYDDENKVRTVTRRYVIESPESIEYGDFVKVGTKYYTDVAWERSLTRRRNNIVGDLTANAEALGIISYVQTLWRNLNAELSAYISTGDRSLITEIMEYEGAWLDNQLADSRYTIRQLIVGRLTI